MTWFKSIKVFTVLLLALAGCERAQQLTGLNGNDIRHVERVEGQPKMVVSIPAFGVSDTVTRVAVNGDVETWQASDDVTIAFRSGIVTATRGLGNDLMSSEILQAVDALRGFSGEESYARFHSYLDGQNKTKFTSFLCRIEEQYVQSDRGTNLQVNEYCTSPDRNFTNTYGLGQNGRIIRSRQWVSPVVGYIETQLVQGQ